MCAAILKCLRFLYFPVCYIILFNPGMRTSTNFFLFSLAISDLTLLFVGKVMCILVMVARFAQIIHGCDSDTKPRIIFSVIGDR